MPPDPGFLHSAIVPHHGPGLIEGNAPIDADHIATCLTHRPEDGGRPGAEMNERHPFMLEAVKISCTCGMTYSA